MLAVCGICDILSVRMFGRGTVKLRRALLILLVVLLVSLPFVRSASADLGDWSGGGDYGGGSSGRDSDDCDGIGWIFYYGIRLGCVIGECAERAGCSHGQVIVFEVIFFAALIGLAALFLRFRRKGGKRVDPNVFAPGQRTVETGGSDILGRLRAVDPNFSEEDLLELLKNRYLQYCDCREKGDPAPLKAYLTEDLYGRIGTELQTLTRANLSEHYERIGILDAKPVSLAERDGMHVLLVNLHTRSVRWTQSTETGEIVTGGRDEQFRTITFELVRPIGTVTASRESEKTSVHCPFCGAPLSLNETSVCPYCDSVLPAAKDTWLIRSIRNG